jgi:hypothetical protein
MVAKKQDKYLPDIYQLYTTGSLAQVKKGKKAYAPNAYALLINYDYFNLFIFDIKNSYIV